MPQLSESLRWRGLWDHLAGGRWQQIPQGISPFRSMVSLATQLSHTQAVDAGLRHALGYPLGCSAAPSPALPASHAHRSHTHVPRNHSSTIHRAYCLQISPDTFCCCCSCPVSNILGSSWKQPGIRRLLYWTAATHRSKTNGCLLDATGNQQGPLCLTERNHTCWVALGDPKTWQGPADMARKLYRGYAQLIVVTCHSERTLSLSCQQEARGNQELLPLPEAVNQLGFAPVQSSGSCWAENYKPTFSLPPAPSLPLILNTGL